MELSIPFRREGAEPLRHVDITLLVSSFLLMVLGAVLVYFATSQKLAAQGYQPSYYLKRDVLYLLAGTVAMVIVAAVDYRVWKGYIPVIYGGTIFVLLAVLSPLGSRSFGARSWSSTPFFDLEPAEFAKPAMIIVLAFVISERRGEMEWRDVLRCLALLAPPALLIFFQPDFGTTLVFVAILLGVLTVGGARPRHLLALLAAGLTAFALMGQVGVLKEYQTNRLKAFLDQSDSGAATSEASYNVQ